MRTEILDTADQAAARAAEIVGDRLRSAAEDRGVATVALSGGGTPERMFEELAKLDVPWRRVHVFQVDERLAPDASEERNLTAVREHLLSHVELPAANLHPMPVGRSSLDDAAVEYARTIRQVAGGDGGLDVVHLGLGADGHTASLFAGDEALHDEADVAPTGEHAGRRRITLTPRCIDRAGARVWLVTGAEKADAVARLDAGDSGIPAGAITPEDSTLVVDREAAAGLAS